MLFVHEKILLVTNVNGNVDSRDQQRSHNIDNDLIIMKIYNIFKYFLN